MFNILKKKPSGSELLLKIDGMHCTSCSLSIDGELEDLPGVSDASTSYAKAVTKVVYDPEKVDSSKIKSVIEKLGYKTSQIKK